LTENFPLEYREENFTYGFPEENGFREESGEIMRCLCLIGVGAPWPIPCKPKNGQADISQANKGQSNKGQGSSLSPYSIYD
jgi:hypothetical protein